MTKYYLEESPCVIQGGVLGDFSIYSADTEGAIIKRDLNYVVIMSQACDITQSLEGDNCNNYLPNIMILPMYILDLFKAGEHLKENYDIGQEKFSEKKLKKLKKNSEYARYHFLSGDNDLIPYDTVIDFKHYYVMPRDFVVNQYQTKYVANIDCLYSAQLSQRFCNYLSRIPIP